MIVVDANLLLCAYDGGAADHARAREWLEEVLSSPDPVGLPWASILAFLRIATNPRALARPLAMEDAARSSRMRTSPRSRSSTARPWRRPTVISRGSRVSGP